MRSTDSRWCLLKGFSRTRTRGTGAWRPPADARTKSEPELPGPEPELPESEHGAAGSGPGAVEPAGLWYRLPEEHEHARSTPTTPAAANLSGGWDVEETSIIYIDIHQSQHHVRPRGHHGLFLHQGVGGSDQKRRLPRCCGRIRSCQDI